MDGVVILSILLSGQRKMNRRTAFRLKNEFEKNYPLKKKGQFTHLYDGSEKIRAKRREKKVSTGFRI